jgi:Fe-S-cluster containining protein
MKNPPVTVPCNGCTLCCRRDMIVLLPEDGDDVDSYKHEIMSVPGAGDIAIIKKGADGNCIYLGADGCTIHDRAPVICRAFDCRDLYRTKTRQERRRLIAMGIASKEVFDAGRDRLHTLIEGERGFA